MSSFELFSSSQLIGKKITKKKNAGIENSFKLRFGSTLNKVWATISAKPIIRITTRVISMIMNTNGEGKKKHM